MHVYVCNCLATKLFIDKLRGSWNYYSVMHVYVCVLVCVSYTVCAFVCMQVQVYCSR